MKAIRHISMLIMTLLVSLLPLSAAAGDTNTSLTVTMQQQPKPTKDFDQELKNEGHRSPARPVFVYISATDGVYSPYFDTEDVISYSICDSDGQLVFTTSDASDFVNQIASCTGVIGIQIELAEYILEGWLQL